MEAFERNIDILPGTKSDVPVIRRLMEEVLAGMERPEWFVIDEEAFLERHVETEGFTLKAVDRDSGAMAAFLVVRLPMDAEDNLGEYLNLNREERRKTAHIESAAVAEHYRGLGLQGRLLREAMDRIRKLDIEWMMATVHPDNAPSRNTFLHAGFEAVTETEKYGGLVREILARPCGQRSDEKIRRGK